MKRKLVKWLILCCMLAYVAVIAVWARDESRLRLCKGIDIMISSPGRDSVSFLTKEGVMRELGDLPSRYAMMPLYAIDTDSLERKLSGVNNFETVECIRTADGHILISVVPMIPELRVFTPKESYYINRDGKRLDAHREFYADLPVVYGDFSDKMPAKDVLPLTRFIAKDPMLSNLVTMIEYRSPRNIILIPRIHGHVINIGDTTDLPEKFDALRLMYSKVMPYKGWDLYDTISVKYKGQVVASRRDKTPARHNFVEDFDDIDPEESSLEAQTMQVTGDETEE